MDALTDIEAQQRAQARQIREDADVFHELMKHKGWPRLLALVDQVAQNHYKAAMKPLESALEVTKTEFAKGVLSGLSLAVALPQLKINEAQELNRSTDEE